MGGNITLASEKGKGSTFYLSVPCDDSTVGSNHGIIVQQPKTTIDKEMTILVAEDEEINFNYLEILLKHDFIKVLHARNGFEAVELCRKHPEICLVFMDLKMPVMDGFEATRLIKKLRSKLPVLAISAYVENEDMFNALEAGCDDYLIKPFNRKSFYKKLEEFGLVYK